MAKNFISAFEEGVKNLEKLNGELDVTLKKILALNDTAQKTPKNFFDTKSPKELNTVLQQNAGYTEQLNVQLREQERLEKALITQIERNRMATEATNRALIQQRVETQQQNRLIKEAAILSSRYSTELQKATVKRNQLARVIQDLNVKRDLGNKLTKEEINLLRRSEREFNRYDKSIRKAREGVGRFQDSVGNYEKGVGGILNITRNLVGAFGIFEGLRLAWDFSKEAAALAREAKGVEFAFNRLGQEGEEAFERVKRSTRGLLSDLDIKRALVEFDNFNISLEQSDTLMEFLAVRATQTGTSIDKLKDSLVEGLSKESKLRIDNLGISAKELNDELSKTPNFVDAVANIAKREIAEAGDIIDEAGNSQERFNAAFENFKVSAGGGFLGELTNDWNDFKASILSTITVVNENSDSFIDFFRNLGRVGMGQGALVVAEAELKKIQEERLKLTEQIISKEKALGATDSQLLQLRIDLKDVTNLELKEKLKLYDVNESLNEEAKRTVSFLEEQIQKQKELLKQTTNREEAKAIQDRIDKYQKEIDAILGNTKARKGGIEALKGSLAFYDDLIKKLEDEQKKLATNSREWKDYQDIIDETRFALEEFKATFEGVETIPTEFKSFKDVFEEFKDSLKNPPKIEGFDYEKLESDTNEFLDNRVEAIKKAEEIGFRIAEEYAERRKELEESVANASIDIVNNVFDSKIQRYQDDIERNRDYYSQLLDNENLTEEQRSSLEAERDAKERELEKKQREQERKAAIFNKLIAVTEIGIDTVKKVAAIKAQAAVLAANPLTLPFAATALAQIPFVIGAGALAIGAIASRPIPQYEHGKTDKYQGPAIWGEKRQEVKVKKDGSVEISPRKPGNYLTHVDKDDVIYPNAQSYLDSLKDDDLKNDMHKHIALANIANQNTAIALQSKKTDEALLKEVKQLNTNFKKKRPIHLHNNNSIGDELSFLHRLNNTL